MEEGDDDDEGGVLEVDPISFHSDHGILSISPSTGNRSVTPILSVFST